MSLEKKYFQNKKKTNWKEVGYWVLQILPGVPTASLIAEYKKPKEKRSSLKIKAGWAGTAFLTTKLVLTSLGIISIPFLTKQCSSYEKDLQTQDSIETEYKDAPYFLAVSAGIINT